MKTCRKAYKKQYRKKNAEKIKAYNKKYREENIELVKLGDQRYYQGNKDKINQRNRERYNRDPAYRTLKLMRCRLRAVLGGADKAEETIELFGCTRELLLSHLEGQFTKGMSWDNQGEWELDHIIPCASFDQTDPEQQRQCWHYTNLQPLWMRDNRSKGAKQSWQKAYC